MDCRPLIRSTEETILSGIHVHHLSEPMSFSSRLIRSAVLGDKAKTGLGTGGPVLFQLCH